MRGLWNLTWLEIKIFAREPLGFVSTIFFPVLMFVVLGRSLGARATSSDRLRDFVGADLPVFTVMLMALNAVLSLVTIIAIYRESGILKRLRATPLRPPTILTAHVIVKLIFTGVTLALMAVAGRKFYPVPLEVSWLSFALALILTTVSILSVGFLVASMVPTARFAQPIGSLILYPMLGASGLFVPIPALPAWLQPIAHVLPLTPAVSLLRGIWLGEGWAAHGWDVVGLAIIFAICVALSSRVFKWQ
ncbi:MAG TPA: ABC transporter permease [Vicinamibacterales bacterium]|nr:ABC transporter permease [Vicinamibacterales bacterium]